MHGFAPTQQPDRNRLGLLPIIQNAIVVGEVVAWGGLGKLIGIGYAALADILVDKYTLADASVGEFIPAAGPNMIVLAVLVPVVFIVFRLALRRGVQAAGA